MERPDDAISWILAIKIGQLVSLADNNKAERLMTARAWMLAGTIKFCALAPIIYLLPRSLSPST